MAEPMNAAGAAATYTYTAYQLTWQLPFPCPVLPPAAPQAVPDVTVVNGLVPLHLDAPGMAQDNWETEPGRFLLRGGRRAGRFLVVGGDRVVLQRNPVAEDEMLSFHFLDAVMAAVLRQRGLLVLHANAASTPRGAVAVSGVSGAGKSTTLAALLRRGCSMLSDDVTALQLEPGGPDGQPGLVEALPGVPQLHLTEDAAEGLGQDIDGLPRFAWRRMKAAVPARADMAAAPAPLRALYLLEPGPGQALQLQPLAGADKFAALQDCIYGPMLTDEHPAFFPLFTALLAQAAVYRVARPQALWTVDELAELIIHG